jgi:hypothetical protein
MAIFTGQAGQIPRYNMDALMQPSRDFKEGIQNLAQSIEKHQLNQKAKAEKQSQIDATAVAISKMMPNATAEEISAISKLPDAFKATQMIQKSEMEQQRVLDQKALLDASVKKQEDARARQIETTRRLRGTPMDYAGSTARPTVKPVSPSALEPTIAPKVALQPEFEEEYIPSSIARPQPPRGLQSQALQSQAQPSEEFQFEGDPTVMFGENVPAEFLQPQVNQPVANVPQPVAVKQPVVREEKPYTGVARFQEEAMSRFTPEELYSPEVQAGIANLPSEVDYMQDKANLEKTRGEIKKQKREFATGGSKKEKSKETIALESRVNQLDDALTIMDEVTTAGYNPRSIRDYPGNWASFEFMKSKLGKRYWAAAKRGIYNNLRTDSGGVIGEDETKNYALDHLPAPFDTDQVIADKRNALMEIRDILSQGRFPTMPADGGRHPSGSTNADNSDIRKNRSSGSSKKRGSLRSRSLNSTQR